MIVESQQRVSQNGAMGTVVPASELAVDKNARTSVTLSNAVAIRHWLRSNTSEKLVKLVRKETWNAHNRQEMGMLMAVSSPTLAYIATGISMDLVYAMAGTFVAGVGLILSSIFGSHGIAPQEKSKT